ncbi:hypothetical protein CEUSTIGMA_g8582.t1 [Chlamydomonas eustigma]|uniref:Uncharacterized protein n=1 Tax=Chlamydomonas eustigma TaxID=1157962 RepID=A0A250XE15_9CHLO|nr:hypothetical protein CEUSTIGMA_g8582.t1 [Chlamydomonas eustigma]|eukprot:GAX81149.1 hypothetical protein CEUSTIGMA_g8582.t1 [Chlamydomonas eustigma]
MFLSLKTSTNPLARLGDESLDSHPLLEGEDEEFLDCIDSDLIDDLMISDSSNPPSGLLGTPGADPLDILDREGLALAAPNLTPNKVNMIHAALPEILPEIALVQRVAPKTPAPRVTSPAPLASLAPALVIARPPQETEETEAVLVAMQRRLDALEAFQAAHLVNPVSLRYEMAYSWKMGVPLFKSAVSKPHILDNEVEGICAWLRAHHLPIPDHLPHFIEDYDVKDFVKSYFKSLPVDVPFIEEDFKTSLKRFVSGESSKGRVAAIQVKRKASEPVQPEQRDNKHVRELKTPPEKCPLWGYTKSLGPAEKALLSEYGICWYCRKSTEHKANTCPQKPSSSKNE